MMPFAIGLTGGIGCGKTTVAAMFAKLGAAVIDTDHIARQLTEPGQPALAAIRAAFGASYILPDGHLDRTRLRQLIFTHPQEKARLETILHPRIRSETQYRLDLAADAPYAVIAIPLLFETGQYANLVQRVLVVDCSERQQLARVMARNGLDEHEVRAIMASQISREERLNRADDVCSNQGAPAATHACVAQLHKKYLELAAKSRQQTIINQPSLPEA